MLALWHDCYVLGETTATSYYTLYGIYLKELFGSESSSQVYAQVTEWMATLEHQHLRKIKWLLYDDMCHLGIGPYFILCAF